VSASTSPPPHDATPGTDQDDQTDEDNQYEDDEESMDDETEDEDDKDDDGMVVIDEDAGGGGSKHGPGAQKDDQGTEDEITEDEIPDRVLTRQSRSQVSPLASEAQMQGVSVTAAALPGVYSHSSRRELNIPAPVDGDPCPGDPGPGEAVTSQQDFTHEMRNQDEQARQDGPMDTQNPEVTDEEQSDSAASVREDTDQDGLRAVSDHQFFLDFLPVAEGLLSESRRLKAGGPVGKDAPLQVAGREQVSRDISKPASSLGADEDDLLDSLDDLPGAEASNALEIAQRALSLNMALQSNEELEEPFSLPWTPGYSLGATEAKRTPEESRRAPPSTLPTGALPLTTHYQLDQGGTMVHAAGQQMPILPAIVQAQNQLQRVGQTQYGPTLSSGVGLYHHRYGLVQPLPATPGPLPAPSPSLPLPAPRRQDGHPSQTQPMYHFSDPTHQREPIRNNGIQRPWASS